MHLLHSEKYVLTTFLKTFIQLIVFIVLQLQEICKKNSETCATLHTFQTSYTFAVVRRVSIKNDIMQGIK